MNSVPFMFCEDVLATLSEFDHRRMANHLSGQWRSAAQRFVKNKRHMFVTISKDSEGWWYGVQDEKTGYPENGPNSHEEFLSMDRTYVRTQYISIYSNSVQSNGHDFDGLDGRNFRCSKEEIARRVVPFLTLRLRPDSSLSFPLDCPKDIAQECLRIFRMSVSFRTLNLVYVGPESEDFLDIQLKNNPFLCTLTLRRWPKTDTTEQLLLTFLNSRKTRGLHLVNFAGVQSPLKVTIGIVKAAVDSWLNGDKKRYLYVEGLIDIAAAEILSIPLPENVTVREEEGEEEENFCVRWIKEDGSSLQCELDFSYDRVYMQSSNNDIDW